MEKDEILSIPMKMADILITKKDIQIKAQYITTIKV